MLEKETPFFKRPLAITDLEMTGLDADIHEIIEIGLVVINQDTLEIIDTLDVKVKPEHIETAAPDALAVNGYKEEDWKDAASLYDAMVQYNQKTPNAVFAGWNITFDWAFMEKAFKKTGIRHTMEYHRIDILSFAWGKLRNRGLDQIRLSAICRYFGIEEEPKQHRAINGAMKAYEVLQKLLAMRD